MAVDGTVAPRRVAAPAAVAPVAAEVGADAVAEVAQAEHGLETGVLLAASMMSDFRQRSAPSWPTVEG